MSEHATLQQAHLEAQQVPGEKANLIPDLVALLTSSIQATRLGALRLISFLSTDPEGRSQLAEPHVIQRLLNFIDNDDLVLVKEAVVTLINLAQIDLLAETMIHRHVISRLLNNLLQVSDQFDPLFSLYAMLLSNVTRTKSGLRDLLNLDDSGIEGYYLSKLILLFLRQRVVNIEETSEPSSQKKMLERNRDNFAWIGTVLLNATTIQEGREMFLKNDAHWLKKMLPFISSANIIQRRSVLGIIKNCLFDSSIHKKFLENSEFDFVAELCLHLRGNEFEEEDCATCLNDCPPSQIRRKEMGDPVCVELILDIFRILTSTLFGREFLRTNQVYPILRELDKSIEDNQALSEKIYNLVYVLMSSDDPTIEDDDSEKVACSLPSAQIQIDVDEHGRKVEQL